MPVQAGIGAGRLQIPESGFVAFLFSKRVQLFSE
jgi:hypothetical protein